MDKKPIKLNPAFKDYIWGGRRLVDEFNKIADLDRIAESWELSANKDGMSTVCSSEPDDLTFCEYIQKNGAECLGTYCARFEDFPVLIKLIDAKENLSVQVHPDEDYAREVENSFVKTEMWYIVDCGPDAYLYYGVNREISADEFAESIENGTVLDLLNKVPVKKGDVFFIPSGTIHAICADTLICEIQQNSNVTYRVYDYGRGRELHIEKAKDVARLVPSERTASSENSDDALLSSCDKFEVRRLRCDGKIKVKINGGSFHSLIVIDGYGSLKLGGDKLVLQKGDSCFAPAQNAEYEITGECTVILTYIPCNNENN